MDNDLSLLMGMSNSAKSSFLYSLIKEYKDKYNGEVYAYGLDHTICLMLGVKTFSSLPELELIKGGIVIIDEVKKLIDISDRRNRKQVDNVFRLVNHKGNKMILSGLPSDFPKYICAKAKVFMYKSLAITDLINGCKAKTHLLDYKGDGIGNYTLDLPINEVLCYDDGYWNETFKYNEAFDTKKDNPDLFVKKKVEKKAKK